MTDSSHPYSHRDRLGWWLKTLAIAATMAGMSLAAHKWILTRASVEEVQAVDAKKADKVEVKETVKAIEKRIDKSERLLGNVHLNLIKLMIHNDVEPAKKGTIEFDEPEQ